MKDDPTLEDAEEHNHTRELRLVFAGSHALAIFAEEIEAIADWQTPVPLPAAPASVIGVVCIRGRMLTVIDAATTLGEAAAEVPRSIVALRGDEQLALAVGRAGDLIQVDAAEMRHPVNDSPLIQSLIQRDEQTIEVLNVRQLFATAMRGCERRRRRL